MDGWKRAAVAEEQKVTIETSGGGWWLVVGAVEAE